MDLDERYKNYLMGNFPLILCDTVEVDRATLELQRITEVFNKELPALEIDDPLLARDGFDLMIWNAVSGWYQYQGTDKNRKIKEVAGTSTPLEALHWLIGTSAKPGVYIMQNFHCFWNDAADVPMYIHLLKEVIAVGVHTHRHLVLIGDNTRIFPEVLRDTVSLDFNLPVQEEIHQMITQYVGDDLGMEIGEKKGQISKKSISAASEAAVGMTAREIEGAVRIAIVSTNGKDIDKRVVFDEKARAVKRTGFLDHIVTEETLDTVGEMEVVKQYTEEAAVIFHDPAGARKHGLYMPRGIVLTGVSGTGKSLTAYAISNKLGIPLYRWDIGKVFDSLVGSTERNTRLVFDLFNAVAPCNVLIDSRA